MARARRASGVTVAAGGLLAGALLLEGGLRLRSGRPFAFDNELERRVRLAENDCAADWDADLGWSPTPAKSGRENLWGTRVTIGADGTRDNGNGNAAKPEILALGDSYTFGDEVSDADTWPAQLERLTGRRVVNAGVCAYGIDQSFMRLEKLLPVFKPKVVVFGLIDLALTRARVSAYPTPVGDKRKPYFRRTQSGYKVAGLPVPATGPAPGLSAWRALGGYSRLVDAVMIRLAPGYWRIAPPGQPPALTGEDDLAVSCALLSELPRAARGAKVIALFEHHVWESPDGRARMTAARACAERAGLQVVEVGDLPSALYLPGGHLSAEGNRRVAEAVASALR